ncbi:hypothetical protein, partial [Vibrio parahaemolyticus]|uniref:hypothetical protein n=1 Tax=Vibrio parahaemolyticus TaxID=670 RepID=UPI0005F121D2
RGGSVNKDEYLVFFFFFYREKTEYEIRLSPGGWEMCKRDKKKRGRISIIWSAESKTVICFFFPQKNKKTAINGGFFISDFIKII